MPAKSWLSVIARILLSLSISACLLWLLYAMAKGRPSDLVPEDMIAIAMNIPLWVFVAYILASLAQSAFRTSRYRLLITAGDPASPPPDYSSLYFVTLARNMFVDMLPSRLGEASYLVLLKRVFGTRLAHGISSLSLSFIFDIAALAAILAGVAGVGLILGQPSKPLIVMTAVIFLIVVVGLFGLFVIFGWGLSFVERFRRQIDSIRILRESLRILGETWDSIRHIRHQGILAKTLALSLGVRLFKYLALMILLLSVIGAAFTPVHPSFWDNLLIALVAGEAAASLPLPTFMSFGSYEMGASFALSSLGYALGTAAIIMFLTHLLSQVFDYALGLLGTLYCVFPDASRRLGLRLPKLLLPVSAGIALLATGLLALSGNNIRDLFSKEPATSAPAALSPAASTPEMTAFEVVDTLDLPPELSRIPGFLVWSTNRFGNHEIVRLDLPSGRLERLTHNPMQDYYPSISPDGTRVLFSRALSPDADCTRPQPWETHMLDLRTGESILVASPAFEASWFPDGENVLFHREGRQVIRRHLPSGEETILAEAGTHNLPRGIEFQTPSVHPTTGSLAVTLRKARRATALLHPDGVLQIIGGGCQLTWTPDGKSVFWVDGPGAGDNAIWIIDPSLEGQERRIWFDAPLPHGHEYFPRVSRDGHYLVYGASAEGHRHDQADYEIFLWDSKTPDSPPFRITHDPANDSWPDIHVFSSD